MGEGVNRRRFLAITGGAAVLPALQGCGTASCTEGKSPSPRVAAFPVMVPVDAACPWNDTGIYLDADRPYLFRAAGQWIDGPYASGPEGYRSPSFLMALAEGLRRVPGADWFALVAAIDRDPSTAQVIGPGRTVAFPRSGVLTCFANDVWGFHSNNSGAISLTIDAAQP